MRILFYEKAINRANAWLSEFEVSVKRFVVLHYADLVKQADSKGQ